MLVIDLSHYERNVDFDKIAAAGVVGVIHKATEGLHFVDPMFAIRRMETRARNLLWGCYHFGTADNPVLQAQYFLKMAGPVAGDLLALDFEDNGAHTMPFADMLTFLHTVQSTLGRRAVLYSGDKLRQALGARRDAFLASHRLWWSQYGAKAVIPPNWDRPWLWQYTDGKTGPEPHAIDGVGPCDGNTYAGDRVQLAAEWAS